MRYLIKARYCYDGGYLYNTREDASEFAIMNLFSNSHQIVAATKFDGQLYPSQQMR